MEVHIVLQIEGRIDKPIFLGVFKHKEDACQMCTESGEGYYVITTELIEKRLASTTEVKNV